MIWSNACTINENASYNHCLGVELNPAYVDVAIERWQSFTGLEAVLAETGETFAALKAKRLAA